VLYISNNNLTTLPSFANLTNSGAGGITIDASHNHLGTAAMLDALHSMWMSEGVTVASLDLTHNRVGSIPSLGLSSNDYFNIQKTAVTLDVSYNPLEFINDDVFSYTSTVALTIDMSFPTAGPVAFPVEFGFIGMTQGFALNFRALGTGATPSLAAAFQNLLNSPTCHPSAATSCNFTLDISSNNISVLRAAAFSRARVTKLVLQSNGLTAVSDDAFDFGFDLIELDVSLNRITAITSGFLDRVPGLAQLFATQNLIQAIPQFGNFHVRSAGDFAGNPLACESYGPTSAHNCTCSPGYTLSVFCGYMRCTPTVLPNGCAPTLYFNASDCSLAPWPSCINASVLTSGNVYYNVPRQSFEVVALCPSTFEEQAGSGTFLPAYQYRKPTATSNRLCSICSTCPTGYNLVPCTSTTNSQCVRSKELSVGAIAAIVMAIIMVLFVGTAFSGYLYSSKEVQRRKLGETQNYLELTEALLTDERVESDRFGKAWQIAEGDVTFGKLLGVGAFGRVYAAMWGYVHLLIQGVFL
jgi:hypothetical protein